MEQYFKRQLKKSTNTNELSLVLVDLDHERKRIKLKASELTAKKPGNSILLERDLKFLHRKLNVLNILRAQLIAKISEIKVQRKISNRLKTNNNSYAETFLTVAAGVLNIQTFEKIQAIALNKIGDNSLATKKHDQTESQPGNTQTLSLPTQEQKLKK